MFDKLTSMNFSLVAVRQTRRRNAAGAHGVCCCVQKKQKVGVTQADRGQSCLCWSGPIQTFGYSCRWKQLYIQNATPQLSSLQVLPVVLAAPVATAANQISGSCVMILKPKCRFRHRMRKFTLNTSGLSLILPWLYEAQTWIVQITFR